MAYYKLTSWDLFSFTHLALPPSIVVQYKIGEWVQPNVPGSSLMVFKNLPLLVKFKSISKGRVFEVEVRDVSKYGLFMLGIRLYMSRSMYISQLAEIKKHSCEDFSPIPDGTLFAGAVKLIREIEVL